MRRWSYLEPGDNGEPIKHTYTEAEILREYYSVWCRLMRKAGHASSISRRACIDDWVVVHWAQEEM